MGKAEAVVETYLREQVKLRGGLTRKIQYIGRRGCADQLVLVYGEMCLVEVKTERGTESVLQRRERDRFTQHGVEATIVYDKKGVDQWLNYMSTKFETARNSNDKTK